MERLKPEQDKYDNLTPKQKNTLQQSKTFSGTGSIFYNNPSIDGPSDFQHQRLVQASFFQPQPGGFSSLNPTQSQFQAPSNFINTGGFWTQSIFPKSMQTQGFQPQTGFQQIHFRPQSNFQMGGAQTGTTKGLIQTGQPGTIGTLSTRFQPATFRDRDQNIQINSIAAMDEFCNFQIEEVRFQDYSNKKLGIPNTSQFGLVETPKLPKMTGITPMQVPCFFPIPINQRIMQQTRKEEFLKRQESLKLFHIKFQPFHTKDLNPLERTCINNISAMPCYQNFQIEEIRYQNYSFYDIKTLKTPHVFWQTQKNIDSSQKQKPTNLKYNDISSLFIDLTLTEQNIFLQSAKKTESYQLNPFKTKKQQQRQTQKHEEKTQYPLKTPDSFTKREKLPTTNIQGLTREEIIPVEIFQDKLKPKTQISTENERVNYQKEQPIWIKDFQSTRSPFGCFPIPFKIGSSQIHRENKSLFTDSVVSNKPEQKLPFSTIQEQKTLSTQKKIGKLASEMKKVQVQQKLCQSGNQNVTREEVQQLYQKIRDMKKIHEYDVAVLSKTIKLLLDGERTKAIELLDHFNSLQGNSQG